MIPIEVETRIALFLFSTIPSRRYRFKSTSLLLPYYLEDEKQPSADEMVNLATKFFEQAMKEYE